MNALQSNIRKSAKAVAVATKIFYIALIVCACIVLSGMIWSLVYPQGMSVQLNDSFRLASPFLNMGFRSRAQMYSWSVYTLADSVTLIAILYIVNRIFRDISNGGAPFELKHAKRMKTIAYLMLIDAVAVPIVFRTWLGMLLSPETVYHGINGTLVVVAVIFFCLSYIFEYGSALQQLDDETL